MKIILLDIKMENIESKLDFCCNLGWEYGNKRNILCETRNFFLVPALGQMGIEGYLLLCSKKHFSGFGDVPAEYEKELENLLTKTRHILKKTYSKNVLVFEHGPRLACFKGGNCLEHAHLHIVPFSGEIITSLEKLFKVKKITKLVALRRIFKKKISSYLFVETQDLERYLIESKIAIPSQYLRRLIASKLNINNWDWRIDSDIETFNKTLNTLKNKFKDF